MKTRCDESGFTLITAIFLLTIVAGLVVYILNIGVVQQTTLLYGVQGARAMHAARSGVEWGIKQSLDISSCPPGTTFVIPQQALQGFNITVTCTESTHREADTTITIYQISSIARSGSYGSLDYVQRRIQATVSNSPP